MTTDFTLEELKALRRIADSTRATPSAPAFWQSIYEKLSLAVANEVCKEPTLELPAREREIA